jgi:hypothetical protein
MFGFYNIVLKQNMLYRSLENKANGIIFNYSKFNEQKYISRHPAVTM